MTYGQRVAYREGWDACQRGKGRLQNPFSGEARGAWWDGYDARAALYRDAETWEPGAAGGIPAGEREPCPLV